jgi:5,10-methylenetetrahydrofolate reductase
MESPDILLGGITIPERHRDKGDEPQRLDEKLQEGIIFFTSQVVYNADNAISMLRHYDELTKQKGKEAARIVFTFAPFGRYI